tara:strand:- start:1498 stop:2007 length:510 start_codon:yes stop_codon:yes gene_type:complete
MKKLYLLILLVISCNSNTKKLDETVEYLEYIIASNPPFNDIETSFKTFKVDSLEKDELEGFFYKIELRDKENLLVSSKTSKVFISEIKNIIMEESMYDDAKRYSIRIGINQTENSESFAIAYNEGYQSAKIDEVTILLPYNKELAGKVKKALLQLGELNNIKINDLNAF